MQSISKMTNLKLIKYLRLQMIKNLISLDYVKSIQVYTSYSNKKSKTRIRKSTRKLHLKMKRVKWQYVSKPTNSPCTTRYTLTTGFYHWCSCHGSKASSMSILCIYLPASQKQNACRNSIYLNLNQMNWFKVMRNTKTGPPPNC